MTEFIKLGEIDTCLRLLEREFGRLKTNELIITNERINHIKTHHPEDFELFEQFGLLAVREPDIILKDSKNQGTVLMIKNLENINLNIVVRLVIKSDDENFKNSVMTFFRLRQKNLEKLKKRNKVLYIKE